MSNLIHITKCLHCNFQLEAEQFDLDQPMNGQVPQRLGEFQMKLLGHIQKAAQWEQKQVEKALKRHQEQNRPAPDLSQAKHLNTWNEFMNRTMLAQGTAIMGAYHTTDPSLNAMVDTARLRLNVVTRKFYFTDEMILEQVQKFNFDPELQEGVQKFVCQVRDALLEQGPYAPKMEQKTSVLV